MTEIEDLERHLRRVESLTDRTEALDIEATYEGLRQQLMKAEWPKGGHGTLDGNLAALDHLIQAFRVAEGKVEALENMRLESIQALKASNEERERYREALTEIARYPRARPLGATWDIARAALSHPISPERSHEGTEK